MATNLKLSEALKGNTNAAKNHVKAGMAAIQKAGNNINAKTGKLVAATKDYSAIAAAGAKGAAKGFVGGSKDALNAVNPYQYDFQTGKQTMKSKAKVVAEKVAAVPVGAVKGAYYEADWQMNKEAGKRGRLKPY